MFGLFSKEVRINSPVTGVTVDLDEVPDEVFSQRMMGDGIAVRPGSDIFVAPADGELTMLFHTGHAFGMTLEKNVEILVHIGIDTVEMAGEGFELLASQGQKVKAGTPIVKVDLELVRDHGYDTITPVIITSPDTESGSHTRVKKYLDQSVRAGQSQILGVNP